ncbi:MAG: PQQ-binding-like beta-propeller repeat protein [Clostridiales bacterium]|nr:PQQ-binding-like beta-propeller repeat protein [Clostridiales bacterium]
MKLKSNWVYSYKKGIRDPLVSISHYLDNNKLFFVLEYGSFPWTSLLLELDLNTQECKTLFEVKHIVRNFVFEDDRFYFTAMNSYVYCIGKDGALIWQTEIRKGNPSFYITIDGNRLYASNHAKFCLDKNSGEIIWESDDYSKKTNCNLLIHENLVISGELGGQVFALDKFTGEPVWDFGDDEWINECLMLDNGHLLVSHNQGKFIILDPLSGNFIKEIPAKDRLYQKTVFDGNRMYVGDTNDAMGSTSGNLTCYEVSGDDFKEVFSFTTGGGISTPALIDGNRLFFASEDEYFYCLDKSTGEELMPKKKTKGKCLDIVIRGDEVVVLSNKGQVEHFSVL